LLLSLFGGPLVSTPSFKIGFEPFMEIDRAAPEMFNTAKV